MCPWPDLNIADRFTPRPWLSVLPPAAAAAAAATSGNLMSERWRKRARRAIYHDQMIAGESRCHKAADADVRRTVTLYTSVTAVAGPSMNAIQRRLPVGVVKIEWWKYAHFHYNETRLAVTFTGRYVCIARNMLTPYLHLATSEMWFRSGGRRILRKLSLCYSMVYYYNGAQRYQQFLQVSQLHRLWSCLV